MTRKVIGQISILLLAGAGATAAEGQPSGNSAATSEIHYPYDPACAWGRIADGKGMLVRCLNPAEAAQLLSIKAPAPTEAGDAGPPPKTPDVPGSPSTPLVAEVASVTADAGKLPIAVRKLSNALGRFTECVEKHGGLSAPSGEVHVRFLVRQRGRAEGVSVSKRRALSEEAARCVADVIDRRAVGIPEAPMVGATAVVKFGR